MLRLRAAAWEDGYAAIEDGDALFMIRPPYRRENKYRVTVPDIERAISSYGFSFAEATFKDWAELIEYLKRRFIESREQTGAPDGDRIMRMIERAPKEILIKFLDRVEGEMFPAREWHGAVLLLTHALRNPLVKQDTGMLETVASLLQKAEERRNQDALSRAGLTITASVLQEEFPLVREMYGDKAFDLATKIQEQGQVLCMGAGAPAS